MGIIENFKRHYRKLLVRRLLHHIDSRKDFTWKPTLLDAIHMTSSAWNQVLPETISKCFRKSWGDGELTLTTAVSEDEDDIPLSVLRDWLNLDPSLNFSDYLNIDQDLATSETDTEECILASLSSHTAEVDEDEEEEEVEVENVEGQSDSIISTSDALSRIRELQNYFTNIENANDDHFCNLAAMEIVLLKRTASFTQSTITSFFTRQ